jgi:hypothetical protein
MRFNRLWWPALLLGATLGCSSPQSYIMLLLQSSSTPIANVAQISVVVSQGTTEMQTLTYPAANLAIVSDASADTDVGTLSVSFSGNQAGDIKFEVTALDARGCAIGNGAALISIIKGATNEGTVFLRPEQLCSGDAGAPDLPPDAALPGCDPTGLSCPAAQSCQVDCQTRSNVCATAGSNAAGAACSATAGCVAGSQCFDYAMLGCGTQLCLQICATDGDCAAFGSGGGGPGSFCRDPIACGGAFRTCTFSCDPTAAATASRGGCPTGLACLITGTLDQVDCACPETTRTGTEGQTCTSAASCAPGQQCNAQSGVLTCRPICRCDAANGSCTATANDCPTAGTHCLPVSTETIYGICM